MDGQILASKRKYNGDSDVKKQKYLKLFGSSDYDFYNMNEYNALFEEKINSLTDPDEIHKLQKDEFLKWNHKYQKKLCYHLDEYLKIYWDRENDSDEENESCFKTSGQILSIYMDMCKDSQRNANASRNLFFPKYRTCLFSRKNTNKVNKDCFIYWGKSQKENDDDDDEEKIRLKMKKAYSKEIQSDWPLTLKTSLDDYKKNGTIMHECIGSSIIENLLSYLGLSGFNVFIPGRIISAKIPSIACTPDICVSIDRLQFSEIYEQMIDNKRIEPKLYPFLPQFWGEIKTIQSVYGLVKNEDIRRLYQSLAKLNRVNSYFGDQDSLLNSKSINIGSELQISGSEWHSTSFGTCDLKDSSKIHLNQLINSEVKNILYKIFKTVKWLHSGNGQIGRNSHFIDLSTKFCNQVSENKLKYLYSSEESRRSQRRPLDSFFRMGKSWILIYDRCICIQEKNMNNCKQCTGMGDKLLHIVEFSKDETPFILHPLSNHYVQVLEQVCCTQYLNDSATYLFIVMTKHESYYNCEEDINHFNHPALVYVYEVIIPIEKRDQFEMKCMYENIEHLQFDKPFSGLNCNDMLYLIQNSICSPSYPLDSCVKNLEKKCKCSRK